MNEFINFLAEGRIVRQDQTLHVSAFIWSQEGCTCKMFSDSLELEQTTRMLLELTGTTKVIYHMNPNGAAIETVETPANPKGTGGIFPLGQDCTTYMIIKGLNMEWTRDLIPLKEQVYAQA